VNDDRRMYFDIWRRLSYLFKDLLCNLSLEEIESTILGQDQTRQETQEVAEKA
jgi:hypothetical protein